MTVWQIYKSRFLYTQAFILIAVVVIYFAKHNPALSVMTFIFLQFAAVYGSWMGKRMVDRLNEQNKLFEDRSDPK